MDWRSAALIAAGVIGCGVALVHGLLVQRLMVKRLSALVSADGRTPAPVRRLIPLLLHFSTFNWFVGGLALIGVALWLGPEARVVTGVLVGSAFAFGAIGNAWATRGRHPGWALYAVAVGLIVFGVGAVGQ